MIEWQNAFKLIGYHWADTDAGVVFDCPCGETLHVAADSGEKTCGACGRAYRCAFTFEMRASAAIGVSTEGAAWAMEETHG